MEWFILVLAGLCEIGWPLGLKISQISTLKLYKVLGLVFAVLSMGLSGLFLWIAQKSIPMGTAYAVWTGIGAVGTFVAGILLFEDQANLIRVFSVILIVAGIVGLKMAHK
jgi:quaternary ammonium compound-resistance protein SugE